MLTKVLARSFQLRRVLPYLCLEENRKKFSQNLVLGVSLIYLSITNFCKNRTKAKNTLRENIREFQNIYVYIYIYISRSTLLEVKNLSHKISIEYNTCS
jgi:hypothetical protein